MWFAWVSEVTRAIWKEEFPHIYTIVSSSESENCVTSKSSLRLAQGWKGCLNTGPIGLRKTKMHLWFACWRSVPLRLLHVTRIARRSALTDEGLKDAPLLGIIIQSNPNSLPLLPLQNLPSPIRLSSKGHEQAGITASELHISIRSIT